MICKERARACALKGVYVLECKKKSLESELETITYDSFSSSVKSLSGFLKAYSVILILTIAAIAISFI